MVFMVRDPTTESLRTVLDLLSLPATGETPATPSVTIDVHDDSKPRDLLPSESVLKVVTDFQFLDDNSLTYIHLGDPMLLSSTVSGDSALNDEDGLLHEYLFQQTNALCHYKQPSTDCSISLTSTLDDQPFSSSGHESKQARTDSEQSDGYTTMGAITLRLPTAPNSNQNLAGMIQAHETLDVQQEVHLVQHPKVDDVGGLIGPRNEDAVASSFLVWDLMGSSNEDAATEVTGSNAAVENTSINTPPSSAVVLVQESPSDATRSKA